MHLTLQLMVHLTLQSRVHLWISSHVLYVLYRPEQTELLTFSNKIQKQKFTGVYSRLQKKVYSYLFYQNRRPTAWKKTPPEIFSSEIA